MGRSLSVKHLGSSYEGRFLEKPDEFHRPLIPSAHECGLGGAFLAALPRAFEINYNAN